jgi:DNA-damage-inducible protein D
VTTETQRAGHDVKEGDIPRTPQHDYQTFEQIRRTDEEGLEYWAARDLQIVLAYASWDKFRRVIEKAMTACEQAGQPVENHFSRLGKKVSIGSGAERSIADVALSRYACYLIVQNGDPSKPVIANGQSYFAVQTRRQELTDDRAFQKLKEDDKRMFLRNELKEHNKQLVETAQRAGVTSGLDFAIFQNHGYKGLYGGLDAKAIQARKGLAKSHKILDHMGSTELAANLFRATQTEEKLRRDGIKGKPKANQTHYDVGKKVRDTIRDLGGTMPEDLPNPATSMKELERESRERLEEE